MRKRKEKKIVILKNKIKIDIYETFPLFVWKNKKVPSCNTSKMLDPFFCNRLEKMKMVKQMRGRNIENLKCVERENRK